ncbi:hypothetical protein NDN08_001894 [Rhodosorus marinus]|uniref:F-box domain-containing protein n=1 Tax=Rhodosorus marinus TaxID=101924 RepID=A0AAV8UVU2_9RHOD|nr:hypothetical protein NDN08_001894 [Rhodosorus marinus]
MNENQRRHVVDTDGDQEVSVERTTKEGLGLTSSGGGESISGRKRRALLSRSSDSGEVSTTMEKSKEPEQWRANDVENAADDSMIEAEEVRQAITVESNKRRRPQTLALSKRGEEFPVDSVPCMVQELEKLLQYISAHPKLREGSASFMRDYLRTLLMVSSNSAATELTRKMQDSSAPKASIEGLPNELVKLIFSFLDGPDLANVRLVCKQWNEFSCEDRFWRELCIRLWPSLDTDKSTWRLIDEAVEATDPSKWRKIYPKVANRPRWKCRLQKTGKFICNLNAHQIRGPGLGDQGLPYTLVVERRFSLLHLNQFVLPEATMLYFEPVTPEDRPGFEQFIDYLVKRSRAGLALEGDRRFIFVPPCQYSQEKVNYDGHSLLGVVQILFPPLQP